MIHLKQWYKKSCKSNLPR